LKYRNIRQAEDRKQSPACLAQGDREFKSCVALFFAETTGIHAPTKDLTG
jgi:hypothetical protein